MAAVDESKATSSISDEAYNLLGCFMDGVDNLVYEMAERLARERNPEIVASGQPIPIEVEDVREAGKLVLSALRGLVKASHLPHAMSADIDQMESCFESSADRVMD